MKTTYSQTPGARRQRERRLLVPGLADKLNADKARRRAKHKESEVLKFRSMFRRRDDRFLQQVAHHLSRGRDPGRIAVWLNEPESRVLAAIAEIKSAKPI